MSDDDFTVGDAARLIGVESSRIRNWQQHQYISFGTKGRTGRYRLSLRDVRCLALMTRLVDHGLEPAIAARKAETIIDRVSHWKHAPLVAVFAQDPKVSPCLVPEDAVPDLAALIVVPMAPLFAEIDARAAR